MENGPVHGDSMHDMKLVTISKGGQISIPADVRRRWGAAKLLLDDRGGELVVRPLPSDPIDAAMGSLAGLGLNSDQLRAQARADEQAAEQRRYGRLSPDQAAQVGRKKLKAAVRPNRGGR